MIRYKEPWSMLKPTGYSYMTNCVDGPWVLHKDVEVILRESRKLIEENQKLGIENKRLMEQLKGAKIPVNDMDEHDCFIPSIFESHLKNTCGGDGWYLCKKCVSHIDYKEE